MRVVLVEPNKPAKIAEIGDDLKSMQSVVGGTIQAIYPWQDDAVALVAHDEGKLLNLPYNRVLEDYDIIAGTFFICGLGKEDFADLSPELAEKYREKFEFPENFIKTNQGIMVVRVVESPNDEPLGDDVVETNSPTKSENSKPQKNTAKNSETVR